MLTYRACYLWVWDSSAPDADIARRLRLDYGGDALPLAGLRRLQRCVTHCIMTAWVLLGAVMCRSYAMLPVHQLMCCLHHSVASVIYVLCMLLASFDLPCDKCRLTLLLPERFDRYEASRWEQSTSGNAVSKMCTTAPIHAAC
jgi:hypothetical protein